jgi:hypothetical protein
MKDIFALYYDPIDMSCCVDVDESMEPLQNQMLKDRLFFPFYQKGFTFRDILSHSGYETNSYRFGSLADNVLGVLFEGKNGVQYKIGARVVKNVTGFDFTRFFTQNENEFGKIKSAILRLRPSPENIKVLNFVQSKEKCEKFASLLLHSTWASSLIGLDYIGEKNNYRIEISIGGALDEILIIKNVLVDFAKKCDGNLIEKVNGNITKFSVQGNLLLSKNIFFGDYLVSNYGGHFKGLLGNGYFLYQPQNILEFSKNEKEIRSEIKRINGNIFWQGQQNKEECLPDVREKMLLKMKEIK